jgi:hypothetical protein
MNQPTDSSTGHAVPYDNTGALPNVTQDTMDEINHQQPPDVVGLPDSLGVDIAPTKKTAVSTVKQDSRLNRLKRPSNARGDVIESRRRCKGDSRSTLDVTAETVRALDPHLSPEEVNSVLNDYKHARRMLNTKPGSRNEDTIPTMEFMIAWSC